jgi:nickel transport system permease protein
VAGFVLRRLALLGPLLLVVSLLVFVILRVGAGDPALAYLRLSGIPPTEATVAEARQALGLDRPLVVQYGDWLGRAVRLDFGTSFVTRRSVLADLLYYLIWALLLSEWVISA